MSGMSVLGCLRGLGSSCLDRPLYAHFNVSSPFVIRDNDMHNVWSATKVFTKTKGYNYRQSRAITPTIYFYILSNFNLAPNKCQQLHRTGVQVLLLASTN